MWCSNLLGCYERQSKVNKTLQKVFIFSGTREQSCDLLSQLGGRRDPWGCACPSACLTLGQCEQIGMSASICLYLCPLAQTSPRDWKTMEKKSMKKGFYCEKETPQAPVPPFPASPLPSPQGGGSGMKQSLKTRS